MFTGIVSHVGTVRRISHRGRGAELWLRLPGLRGLRLGESLAVDGVCLTVKRSARGGAGFDLSAETLRRTTLGRLSPGDAVNCERPMRFGDRLGGHLVAGHVDGIGRVAAVRREGKGAWMEIEGPAVLSKWLLPKGSVAVNGVSLTVARVRGRRFATALIPVTLRRTNLRLKKRGDAVNLEADLFLKWLERRRRGKE